MNGAPTGKVARRRLGVERDGSRGRAIKRRRFLGGLTATSFRALLEGTFAEPAQAQTSNKIGGGRAGQDGFESPVEIPGNKIFVRRYGSGPAILLVHGFARTSLMWRFLAPKLAKSRIVICVDVRACIPTATDEPGVNFDIQGHIEIALLEKLGARRHADYYLCGPTSFLQNIGMGLRDWEGSPTTSTWKFSVPSGALHLV